MRKNLLIPELLAPAGSIEMMKAVIGAGADAIYIGGSRFGARAYADNPETDELCEAIDYAHLHGVAVHMTVNTLVKEREMDSLCEYVEPYYRCGVDAVLVQDLGVLRCLHENFPYLPLHASTQMSVTGIEGIRLLEKEGVKRVVFARELSLAEIREIRKETDMELEVFAHGALCVCYSGRCLMSSMLGGRSGNRGRCAQPCRLPYDLGSAENMMAGKKFKPLNPENEKYLLSPKDLCTIELLPQLIEAGVDSLKIEGRMKKPEYAAGVTAIYRKYLDMLAEQLEEKDLSEPIENGIFPEKRGSNEAGKTALQYRVAEEDKKELFSLFNRDGFTDGYLTGNTAGMMAQKNAKYTETSGKSGAASQERKLPQPEKLPVSAMITCMVNTPMVLSVSCDGCGVTVSGDVPEEAAKQPVTEEKIASQIRKTGDSEFTISDLEVITDGKCFIPVSSLNRIRREALDELKDEILLPYRCRTEEEYWKIIDPDPVKIPMTLDEAESPSGNDPIRFSESEPGTVSRKLMQSLIESAPHSGKAALEVLVSDFEQLEAALSEPSVDRIIAEWSMFLEQGKETIREYKEKEQSAGEDAVPDFAERCHSAGKEAFLALPYIVRHGVKCGRKGIDVSAPETLRAAAEKGIDGFLARDSEGLAALLKAGLEEKTMADSSLYTMNRTAQCYLKELGVASDTAPFELTIHELEERDNRGSVLPVYGYIPLMVTAQCPMRNNGHCLMKNGKGAGREGAGKNGRNEERDGNETYAVLRDRKKQTFPMKRECVFCCNILYNSVPLSLLTEMKAVRKMGFAAHRLMFTMENAEQVRGIIRTFSGENLSGKAYGVSSGRTSGITAGKADDSVLNNYTKGHFRSPVE